MDSSVSSSHPCEGLCKYSRGQIAYPCMPALAVIKNPDVFLNGRFCLHPGFKALVMDSFIFRAAPEALNRGIAVTMAFSRHGSDQAVFLKLGAI